LGCPQGGKGTLGGPFADAHLGSDLGPGVALGAQRGYLGGVHNNPRPSQLLAFSSGITQSGSDPLLNEGGLKFSHRADDLKHQPTGRGAQGQVVTQTDEGHARGGEISE